MCVFKRWGFAGLALVLAAGWSYRELARAADGPKPLASATINLDQVEMVTASDKGQTVGKNGVYIAGDTPHDPHTHLEEEIMIIESGHGEILCDGKTTKVGPGSVMYSTPNTQHGITNTGDEPIVFYYVKWQSGK
jgi:mannose-6-phosphate isomerase-like protein (cupin superfamily)